MLSPAPPLPDPAELDRRIAAVTEALAARIPGTGEHRAARVELATLLFARYTAAGAEDDRATVAGICRDVLADPGATPRERQAVAMIQPVLTMLALFRPGTALPLGGDDLTGTMQEVAAQADAVPGAADLPPEVRSVVGAVGGMAHLVADMQRPEWDGRIAPEDAARLADLPGDLPGRETVSGLLAWLGGPADPAARTGDLRTALAGLDDDHPLAPVLRLDLATALAGDPATAGRDALAEAEVLLERARAGMGPGHPMYDETVRSLAGVLLATTAHAPTEAAVARVEQVVGDVLARPRDGGCADRGTAAFLQSVSDLLRSTVDGDRAAESARRGLIEAVTLLPADHPLRPVVVGQAAALLSDRSLLEGRIAAADIATQLADELVGAAARVDDGSAPFLRCVVALVRVVRAGRTGDVAQLRDGAAALRAGLADLPGHDLMRPNFAVVAAVADLQLAAVSGDRVRLWAAVQEARRVLDTSALAGVAPDAAAALAGTLDALGGALDEDPATITAAIARMEADLDARGDAAVTVADQRVGRRVLLGQAHLAAHAVGVDGAADRAVAHLTAALALLGERRPGVARREILRGLAAAHRARGDRRQAREAAFAALEALAGVVLLQSGAAHGVLAARGAAADAATLARWCLADGDPARAAQAIELGRGLALHAAVSTARVPDLLRAAERPDLAQEWEQTGAAAGPVGWAEALAAGLGASGDLRERVLDALRVEPDGSPPVRPARAGRRRRRAERGRCRRARLPGAWRRRRGRPPGAGRARRPRPGRPGTPAARGDRRPRRPVRARSGTGRRLPGAAPGAARRMHLGRIRRRRAAARSAARRGQADPPRVVLVPSGVLGAVPWAAAHLPGDGPARVRHACAELVLSTAASARQLLDVAHRTPATTGPVVLVGDPTGRSVHAAEEVTALHDAVYADAVVLGVPGGGPGTPEELLARLPGARLVHLACHAVAADRPDESRLDLTAPLPVRRVLDRVVDRDAAAGPVVVLSGCSSDRTAGDVLRGDHDEALTLATAFLAAGAATVVGTRWDVVDRFAGIVAFAVHHFLALGRPAADALRCAQLWLLDDDREPLPGMPEPMHRRCRRGRPVDVSVWAAFGHQGR